MFSPIDGIFHSIAGRLYAALGILCAVLLATNAATIVYSDSVAAGAGAIAHQGIDGVRVADNFDELLDAYRRAVTGQVEAHASNPTKIWTGLAVREQDLTEVLTTLQSARLLSADLQNRMIAHVAKLRLLAHAALELAVSSQDSASAADATDHFLASVNEVEEDVLAWKAQMRETMATELTTMSMRASHMHKLYVAATAVTCLIGFTTVLVSRGVLRRLGMLTRSMLSLAAGDIDTAVPFDNDKNEVGQLANALKVFRDNARRIIASEANLSAALESMVEAIVIFSEDGGIVLHNRHYGELLGGPGSDYTGMTMAEISYRLVTERAWPAETIGELQEKLAKIREDSSTETFDVDVSQRRSYRITATAMPNGKLLVSMEDISERRASADRIFHLANHDILTGLPNRAAFQEKLELAVDNAVTEHGFAVTLLLCDLDHFKEVNDTYGHLAGDELLQQVGSRIRATMRKTDILARLGGDEFAIIHLSGSEPQEAEALAGRVVAALKQPFEIHAGKVCVGVSIGIACAPLNAASPVELLKHADLALYAAKQAGRDMFVLYDTGMAEQYAERRALEEEMRLALEAGAFCLHYQPQVDLRSRRIIGFEALARWSHPTRGMVPPDVFIPVAEQCGLIVRLGEWVLRRACSDAVTWDGEISIAVNVASQQFRHEGFVDMVLSVLRETGLAPQRLELEITETAMLNDGEQMLSVLNRLREAGVRLSLDDFGTGYSALNYLQKFPFDKIKIDQSFVQGVGHSAESDAIVRAVVNLGLNLRIKTLAEGVETEDQACWVFDESCGEAQGYLFGRAVPASEVGKLLAEAPERLAA